MDRTFYSSIEGADESEVVGIIQDYCTKIEGLGKEYTVVTAVFHQDMEVSFAHGSGVNEQTAAPMFLAILDYLCRVNGWDQNDVARFVLMILGNEGLLLHARENDTGTRGELLS